jgi:hypothetical protein
MTADSTTIQAAKQLLWQIAEDPSTSRSLASDIKRMLPALTLEQLRRLLPKLPPTGPQQCADNPFDEATPSIEVGTEPSDEMEHFRLAQSEAVKASTNKTS